MFYMGTYEFLIVNTSKIGPEKSFTNAYVEEIHESEQFHTSTKRLFVILYAEYEKAYLHKVLKNQCQNLTETQRNELLKLFKNRGVF